MRSELELKLVNDFPLLYNSYYTGDIRETLLPFGFECGDGWYNLLYELSTKLNELFLQFPEEENRPIVIQIKEKYGALCYYISWGTDEMFDLIVAAEKKSLKTCEQCGKPGETKKVRGWYTTICFDCFVEMMKKG